MANDPYTTLGISRTATADEIRAAYRGLAKKNHPDLHPGDAAAEARFKTINAANSLLSDPELRARFDRGEIDAEGQPTPPRGFYRDHAQEAGSRYRPHAAHAAHGGSGGEQPDDLGDIFGAFFNEQASRTERPRRGRDAGYTLAVPFLDVVTGATERLTLPDGAVLDVRIPPGLEDGQVLRLRGKGGAGSGPGAADGDALITVTVRPHPLYRREGMDLVMDIPITFAEAVLGARIEVPTPQGRVMVSVPPRADSGTRLRLRGRGVAAHAGRAAGDLHVVLRLVTGPVDAALETFLQGWAPAHEGFDPRAGLEGEG